LGVPCSYASWVRKEEDPNACSFTVLTQDRDEMDMAVDGRQNYSYWLDWLAKRTQSNGGIGWVHLKPGK
jgi:hypothetical protein